jgi:dTMP kinase
MSPEQIAEISAAIARVPQAAQTPVNLLQSLLSAQVSAFLADDLAAALSVFAKLDRPVTERPFWEAASSRGRFVVFEGLDRSGKSTQSRLLTESFEQLGKPVKWTCFPNRSTTIGTLIDLYLRSKIELSDKTVHLLFSANRWEMADSIVGDLSNGTSIVCDRYAFSGAAYSAAKGLDFTWCQAPDLGLPTPDGIFFLHLDEKVGASRANYGDERYENAAMQAAVRKEFQRPELRDGVAWHDVDAARDIDTIKAEIAGTVDALEKRGAAQIRRLWVE